jgi:signal transduction histidine kinase
MKEIQKTYEYLHPVTLAFRDATIEKEYHAHYRETYITANRLCIFLAIGLYAIFGILDFFNSSHDGTLYQTIRYGFTIPLSVIIFILSLHSSIATKNHTLFTIGLLFFAISILTINLIAEQNSFSTYNMGFVLLFFFGQNFLKISFFRSTSILLAILLIFEIYTLAFKYVATDVFITISFFLFVSYLLSTFSSYFFELIDRKNYWNSIQLQKTNDELKNLQKLMEQKVTERTNMLEKVVKELQTAKAKAEESNIIKSTFLSTISHEIRTPLTSILGFTQLITKTKTYDEKTQVYAATIEKSIAELLDIMTNILTLSEIHNDRLEKSTTTIHFKTLKKQILAISEEILARRKKNLKFQIISNEPVEIEIPVGEKELLMVIKQLIDNAIKYTGAGHFSIECIINELGMFQICVKDTGIGINAENLHSIFDFFIQEDQLDTRMYNGIGVGLSICKGIITKAGGKIWAESEKNKGSAFYVTIPIEYNSNNE